MLDFNVLIPETAEPDKLWDLIILGGGPAGLTAGIYAARYKLETLLLEKSIVSGGQLTATQWIENYPGFREPVLGKKLAADMEAQAKHFGLKVISENVQSVNLADEIKEIETDYAKYQAKTVIIATGSSPRRLGLSDEQKYAGNGVSYCSTCDAPFFKDKVVAVVGGGNTAFEEALFITKYASQLYLIHRREEFTADRIFQDKVFAEPNIKIITNSVVTGLNFDLQVGRSLNLQNTISKESSELEVDGIFIFIGNLPNTALFTQQLELDEGYVVTNRKYETNQKGVWAIGDVQKGVLRQVATAVGDGAGAAHQVNKYLVENH
ncbi:MAG: thioredoxin-disulfide reductase [Candidatus Cloacimonetes bacterium]|nr:thioredoxin-disulfide reductase [Candidatus Cloacimonadota bacterium]